MKIKELIQTGTFQNGDYDRPLTVQGDDPFHKALQKLLKSQANHLKVYEHGVFLGVVPLMVMMEKMIEDYKEERELRYQLFIRINLSLTKLKSQINKIKNSTAPITRDKLIKESEELINSLQHYLR